jgi:hypothetical protein
LESAQSPQEVAQAERLGEELKAGHSGDRFPAVPKLIGE